MNKEIERKYAVNYIPENLEIEKVQEIEQSTLYRDGNTMIRIRKLNIRVPNKEARTEYIYTVKTNGDIEYDNSYSVGKKYEIESNIPKEEYEKLIQKKIGNTINKTRIVILIEQNLKVELDIYYDYLEGLLTAEIEFPNEELASTYKKPNWLGKELGYKKLSNGKLSMMTREEFKSKVSEEFLDNNRKIITNLKRHYDL